MTPLRVGIIGYGFMGRAHSNAYKRLNDFFPVQHRPVLKAVCARDAAKAQSFADNWGYERVETDWRRLIDAPDIDLIDIASPNDTHYEIAIAAAQAGKMIVCEKPLAMNVREAEEMTAAVEKAGVPNMVWGAGLWRLDVNVAGSGVTGDLLAHSIDTAMWLNGPISRVTALTRTFIKERAHAVTGAVEPVGIDDACMFLAEFANGSIGTFESTRYARGRKNFNTFEMNGADGSVYFDLEEPEYLSFFEYKQVQSGKKTESHLTGWRKIHVTNPEHPWMNRYWVPGTTIGYEHTFLNALADFVAAIESGQRVRPDFRAALATQRVCEAVLQSAESGSWVNITTSANGQE
ncbi:MAG: Gfo/Idh/MocA family oxidoreductase [Acidobacteria bacterium]|nr:Gfo/Idh/MocA family oxidoreductase [Acidobacteriota bacterium]